MADKGLNGAYYGPPIPPRNGYRSVGRSYNPCGSCLCTLFKFLVTIVVIIGILVLAFWLVFRPSQVKAYVVDARLSQFTFDNTTRNLQYNLNLTVTIRNPNRRIGIYYDYIEAQALYQGDRFGFGTLPPFHQGHKTNDTVHPSFEGRQLLLGSSAGETYSREKGEGFYEVEFKIRTKLRAKIWIFKIHYNRQKIDCDLKLPAPGTSGTFQSTKCDVDFF